MTPSLDEPLPLARVLVVDDHPVVRSLLSRMLTRAGFETVAAQDGRTALQELERGRVDVMALDFQLPDMTGLDVLLHARTRIPHLPAVMITGNTDVHSAVEAMRAGVYDYICKPINNDAVVAAIKAALNSQGLHDHDAIGSKASELTGAMASLRENMGPSAAIDKLIKRIGQVAQSDFSVLILGETGTGKELIANAVHQVSRRHAAMFLPIDCGAIPEHLFESELFGYEKGAFTGATSGKRGKFLTTQGGTLFLDEIANLPLSMQAKLLRVLQERVIYPIGGHAAQEVDVRIIAAANEDLEQKALDGRFRSDLFFRLSEFVIHLPPLRERPDDICHLTHRFLSQTNDELGKTVGGFSDAAHDCLQNFAWPGNVRQLRNTVRQAVLLADEQVCPEHLDIFKPSQSLNPHQEEPQWDGLQLKEAVRRSTEHAERKVLEAALNQANGNKAMAARFLGIDYKTMLNKIKEYGIKYKKE